MKDRRIQPAMGLPNEAQRHVKVPQENFIEKSGTYFRQEALASIGWKTKLLRLIQRIDVITKMAYLSPEVSQKSMANIW